MKKTVFFLVCLVIIGSGEQIKGSEETVIQTSSPQVQSASVFHQLIGIITVVVLANLINYLLTLPIAEWQKKNPHWAFNMGFVISSLLPQVLEEKNPLTKMIYNILQLRRTETMIQDIQNIMQAFSKQYECKVQDE